jgi:hypothetical protein
MFAMEVETGHNMTRTQQRLPEEQSFGGAARTVILSTTIFFNHLVGLERADALNLIRLKHNNDDQKSGTHLEEPHCQQKAEMLLFQPIPALPTYRWNPVARDHAVGSPR